VGYNKAISTAQREREKEGERRENGEGERREKEGIYTCSVKKAQSIGFSSYHYCHCIVIKYLESEAGREREREIHKIDLGAV
jgi:hypothetical protein